MKKYSLLPLLCLALASCATDQSNAITTASSIANLAVTGLQAYQAARTGTLTPTQVTSTINTASADLSGMATVAQAYIGKTPTAAKISQGANSVVGNQVQAALPNAPITQGEVDNLWAAAALVAKK